jgi:putative serine protease PepD
MNNVVKVAFLTSVTTAAIVYVLLEWRPMKTMGVEAPIVSWASPVEAPTTVTASSSAAQPAAFDADEQNNIDIYRKYSPGVVNIASKVLARDLFLRPYPVEAGTGSGVIVDSSGNIATNYHVVEPSLNGGELEVTLADKSKYKASIVGADQGNDLAVIRIDAPKDKIHPVPIGTSNTLIVGQKVLAIGNPYGLEQTLTTGVISALGRSIQAEDDLIIENIIQTDAAINPGNSGGPLLNRAGQIIGINTAIVSPASGNVGIGFAIPADTVKRVVGDLISYGYVRRPYLGLSARDLYPMEAYNARLAAQLGIEADRGFMIFGMRRDSPLARAGVRAATQQVQYGFRIYPVGGDVLIGFQGKEIQSLPELFTEIDHFKAGETVTLTVMRGSQKIDVRIVLQETPPPQRR